LEEDIGSKISALSHMCMCLSFLYNNILIGCNLDIFNNTLTQGDYYVLHYIAKILELIVRLMEHPSESFLAQLEEDIGSKISALSHMCMCLSFLYNNILIGCNLDIFNNTLCI
jgi:hypothetical protein